MYSNSNSITCSCIISVGCSSVVPVVILIELVTFCKSRVEISVYANKILCQLA